MTGTDLLTLLVALLPPALAVGWTFHLRRRVPPPPTPGRTGAERVVLAGGLALGVLTVGLALDRYRGFDMDAERDWERAVAAGQEGRFALEGPAIHSSGWHLGPTWTAIGALAARLGRAPERLLLLQGVMHLATLVLGAGLLRRAAGPAAGAFFALLWAGWLFPVLLGTGPCHLVPAMPLSLLAATTLLRAPTLPRPAGPGHRDLRDQRTVAQALHRAGIRDLPALACRTHGTAFHQTATGFRFLIRTLGATTPPPRTPDTHWVLVEVDARTPEGDVLPRRVGPPESLLVVPPLLDPARARARLAPDFPLAPHSRLTLPYRPDRVVHPQLRRRIEDYPWLGCEVPTETGSTPGRLEITWFLPGPIDRPLELVIDRGASFGLFADGRRLEPHPQRTAAAGPTSTVFRFAPPGTVRRLALVVERPAEPLRNLDLYPLGRDHRAW